MSNHELIMVKPSKTGGCEVVLSYNGYSFQVIQSREDLTFRTRNDDETDELLQVLEGILEKLKRELTIAETLNRMKNLDAYVENEDKVDSYEELDDY